ncbi:MAG: NAD(P)/FAD-dependent oxidoreductase [Gammaproteobacteria bacterium]|nr:NAD(P)/FAD-dependent oxidoreductase [Gammaproteobacteria bacterium]
MRASSDLEIAVIGAGMSGILTAIRLLDAGFKRFVIYEKADRLGGTWRENTYPGLSCDVPSHHYVYSFEPNPDWSHMFSPGPEIYAYFDRVAQKYGVESYIRYDKEVTRAEFRDQRWALSFADGEEHAADIVIAATGVLHHPVIPGIEGLDGFKGPSFHTARWDHSVSLDGRRVGIIGTGSTAIQIVAAIIDRVDRLSLFQRTAQWILPLANPPFSEEEKAAFRREPDRLVEIYQNFEGQFNHTFARAVIGDARQMRRIEERCEANLEENIADPDLRGRLTPNYQVACKRLIMSDTFYPAIQKPNARLVTANIERIEASGVRTNDQVLHELDVLVLATGFDGHRFMRPMEITGIDGVTLNEIWAEGVVAHRCVTLPGFPNFFVLIGPNSPIGNFSLILVAELQVNYILQLIDRVRSGQCRAFAPKAEATARFNEELHAAMKNTVWVSGCKSWYLDKNGNPVTWPWSFERFEADMKAPKFEEFDFS